ncbi:N-methyl-L-tryptophan oxidase [Candidatus Entotheonella palauensis]|nr:N-methyl-L-tryptophan oxidase [Candidatus Entotheonella palauensis]
MTTQGGLNEGAGFDFFQRLHLILCDRRNPRCAIYPSHHSAYDSPYEMETERCINRKMQADNIMEHFNLIVVGLGAMGAATLYQAAKQGAQVLGIDRFQPPHTQGSTHGETRMTRLAVGEGPQYVPLVKRSHEIWQALTEETGQPLLYLCGLYTTAPKGTGGAGHYGDFVDRVAEIAEAQNLPYERLTAAEVRQRHPAYNVPDSNDAILDPNGGVIDCEAAVQVQLQLAQQLGAKALFNTMVVDVVPESSGVQVKTAETTFTADQVVVAAGGWVRSFLPNRLHSHFCVTRQVIYWMEVDDPAPFAPEHFPAMIWPGLTDDEYLGVFPMLPNRTPGLKVQTEKRNLDSNPDTVDREVSEAELNEFVDVAMRDKVKGVKQKCLSAKVCLYTETPDHHFVVDHHPDSDRIIVVSPCSGHGFKHSAALGEGVAQWALNGQSQIDLSAFSW